MWGNDLRMIYRISHRTTYKYAYPVSVGDHVACLKPRSFPSQNQLLLNTLEIRPTPTTFTERIDYFGNLLCFFTVQEPHKELIVEAKSEVVVNGRADLTVPSSLPWEESARSAPKDLRLTSFNLSRHAYGYGRSLPRTPCSRLHPEGRCERRLSI
jgi:transglutaminase-like putative cysteine protease